VEIMIHRTRIVATCCTLLALSTSSAGAQRLLTIGLGGGVSLPSSDLSNGSNTGWNALATLVLSTPMQPLGLRADVAYNQFGFSSASTATFGSGHQNVGSLTANVTYRLPTPGTPISPYLITGLGAYRTDCSVDVACQGATHFGWNAGLGTKLYALRLRSFLEARYHRTSANGSTVSYFPITLGLSF
jgi:outer membrane protein with beta-barrel domain